MFWDRCYKDLGNRTQRSDSHVTPFLLTCSFITTQSPQHNFCNVLPPILKIFSQSSAGHDHFLVPNLLARRDRESEKAPQAPTLVVIIGGSCRPGAVSLFPHDGGGGSKRVENHGHWWSNRCSTRGSRDLWSFQRLPWPSVWVWAWCPQESSQCKVLETSLFCISYSLRS